MALLCPTVPHFPLCPFAASPLLAPVAPGMLCCSLSCWIRSVFSLYAPTPLCLFQVARTYYAVPRSLLKYFDQRFCAVCLVLSPRLHFSTPSPSSASAQHPATRFSPRWLLTGFAPLVLAGSSWSSVPVLPVSYTPFARWSHGFVAALASGPRCYHVRAVHPAECGVRLYSVGWVCFSGAQHLRPFSLLASGAGLAHVFAPTSSLPRSR